MIRIGVGLKILALTPIPKLPTSYSIIKRINGYLFKDIYFVIYGFISEFTDKGQFQYLTKLKGSQVGNYLYTTQFLLLR